MNMKHQNTYLFRDILERVEVPVNVEPDKEYVQIGIRSHGKGLFYKEPVLGKALGNKQVFWIQPNCFILNVVFAWEQAITKTTENEIGMIGSHRFPMYRPKNDLVDIDYLIYYFLTKRGTDILEAASPGGAGRNRTLGQERFLKSKITLPPLPEQQKIATILSTQDKVIELKERLLAQKQQQKKYLMQQLLTGKLRLPDVNGEWASVKLKELLIERNEKNVEQNHRICSVAVSKGVVDQIEHLGRSYAAADTSNYGVAHYGDIIYTRSPTGDFSLGIIKQNRMRENVAISPLYGIYKPISFSTGYLLNIYFESTINTKNYLTPIVQKGAKNTIAISNSAFLENKIFFPMDEATQSRIAKVFELTDHEIDLLQKSIEAEKQKKKALMQLLLTGKVRVKI
jgi:type I restriction enzyme S subunit